MVGEDEVVVTHLARGHHHLLDRRPAVGPVGVRVQVPPQRRPGGGTTGAEWPSALLQLGQRAGHPAGQAVGDHRGRLGAHPGQVAQRASRGPLGELARRTPQHGGHRAAVGLDPIAVGEPTLHQERDPAQRRHRVQRRGVSHGAGSSGRSWVGPFRRSGLLSFVHSLWLTILAGQRGRGQGGPGVSPTASYTVVPRGVHRLCSVIHRWSPAPSTGTGDAALTTADRRP